MSLSFFLLSFRLLSRRHSDQMSEGSQVSKVTLYVQILKCHNPPPRVGIELPGQLKKRDEYFRGEEILSAIQYGSGSKYCSWGKRQLVNLTPKSCNEAADCKLYNYFQICTFSVCRTSWICWPSLALGSLSQIWATLSRSWETRRSTTKTGRDWPSGFSGEQHSTPLSDHDLDDNHRHGKGSNAVFIAPAPMLFLPACSVSQNDANIRPGALSSRRARLTSMHTNYPSSFFWLFSSSDWFI